MAFDFPSGSLTVGQIVTGPNNIQYQWDGTKWVALTVSPGTIVSSFNTRSGAVTLTSADLNAVDGLPIAFAFSGKPGASQRINIPMAIAVTVAASLTGSVEYASTAPAATATFTINKVSGGTVTAIGSVGIAPGGGATFTGAGGSLAINDVLQCVAPATQDTSLADVGISILCMRV